MSDAPKVSFFKKGKIRPTSTRQRSPPRSSPPPTAARMTPADASEVVRPTRRVATRLLSQGTKRPRQEDDGSGDTGRVDVNWAGGASSNVNAALDILEGDAVEALLERKRARLDPAGEDADGPDDGLYKGQAGYKKHIAKSQDVPKKLRVDPQKSMSTIRTATIMDYQPDVCKDYKETGFCGYGDSCKFLHDRGTYMAGWQLDKLATDAKDVRDAPQSDSDSDEDIPFACLICRKPYVDPIVTRCGHYFCSSCAIKRFAKTPKCLACGAPTGGIFNRADKVIQKLNEKKERQGGEDEEEGISNSGELVVEGLANDDTEWSEE